MPLMPSQAIIKPSTFDGISSWQLSNNQFTMVSEANRWSPTDEAFHIAASLRGDAASVLETLSEAQSRNFDSLSSALVKSAQKNIVAYS